MIDCLLKIQLYSEAMKSEGLLFVELGIAGLAFEESVKSRFEKWGFDFDVKVCSFYKNHLSQNSL